MRLFLPTNQQQPAANATVTLWEDGNTKFAPSLLQKGMRELTLGSFCDVDYSVTLSARREVSETYETVFSGTVEGSSMAQQEHFDLTGLQGQLRVQITMGSAEASTYRVSLEANDELQAGGCSE